MAKFIKIQTCYLGDVFDEVINIEDIGHISLGANVLFLRTPYADGDHHQSITQESVDKLLKVLDIVEEVE